MWSIILLMVAACVQTNGNVNANANADAGTGAGISAMVSPKVEEKNEPEAVAAPTLTLSSVARVVRDRGLRSTRKNLEKVRRIAGIIESQARRWHVDPLLVACITASESNFRDNPPPVCRKKIVGGVERKVCDKKSVGMMQSLPRQKVTKFGFWLCYGSKRKYRWTELLRTKASFCVGSYELSTRRFWVRTRRIKARNYRHRKFLRWMRKRWPAQYRSLKENFWTAATYNWGPRILHRNRGRWDSVGYPIRVMRCYTRYMVGGTGVEKVRSKS